MSRHPDAGIAPARILCSEIQKGQRIDQTFLVETWNFKQTRNGKYFIQMELRDRTGSIKAIRWEATPELYSQIGVDDFLRVAGRVEEFQQHLQIIVDDLSQVSEEGVELAEFLPHTSRDIDQMLSELLAILAELKNPHLRQLLADFMDDPEVRRGMRRCPAGKSLHHAYIGGLLEHVLSLAKAARCLSPNYPQLDGDLLIAASVLHDIGKLRELSFARSFRYTDLGQLVGHIALGITWVEEKARKIPQFPADLLVHLQHIIGSHHGLPEHGAVKPPMTPEAMAFHYLDDLDAKLASLDAIRREQRLGGDGDARWSVWNPALGRRLYFPGAVSSPPGAVPSPLSPPEGTREGAVASSASDF
jgi:3'-5' exoribonuclease